MIGYSKSTQLSREVKKKSQTEINIEANKSLDEIYEDKKLFDICEAKIANNCLPKVIESYGKKLEMTYAHRHKRNWYKQKENRKLLGTFKQTIRACLHCHTALEASPELTEKVFLVLRGSEES